MGIFDNLVEAPTANVQLDTQPNELGAKPPERQPIEGRVCALEAQVAQLNDDLQNALVRWMTIVEHRLNRIMHELNL